MSVLANKYRPKKLSDLIGQDTVVKVLTNSIKSGKLHHAYIFAGKFGCGKCITGNSIVFTPLGLRRIEDIVPSSPNGEKTFISTINQPVIDETGIGISEYGYFEKESPTIRIETIDGFSIEGTPEHPVKVIDNDGNLIWKKLQFIEKNDSLAISRSDILSEFIPEEVSYDFDREEYASSKHESIKSANFCLKSLNSFAVKFIPDKDFARFLGFIISEGHVSDRFSISNTDYSIIDHVLMVTNKLGINLSTYNDSRREKAQKIASTGNSGFVNFCKNLGIDNLSNKKYIPNIVLKFPRSLMIDFLRAYFEGDGGIDGYKVTATSMSRRLLSDIQTILLSMGILSRLHLKKTKCSNCIKKEFVSWRLSICGQDLLYFANKIGFLSTRKQESLNVLCNKISSFAHFDIVPGWNKRLIEMKKSLPISKNGRILVNGEYIKAPKWQSKVIFQKNQQVTYSTLKNATSYLHNIIHIVKNDKLHSNTINICNRYISIINNILSRHYYYSKVSILEEKVSDVYDLCKSKEDHSFYANGFVNHNTSSARIFAASVNGKNGMSLEPDLEDPDIISIFEGKSTDIKEIDAASSGSIDDIRNLQEEIRYSPLRCKYRFVIIDEAHRLTGAAAEAALKMIEEPPQNVIFILATTDADKLKDTIHSRCMPLRFNKVSWDQLFLNLKKIAQQENIEHDEIALKIAARLSKGSVRNSIQNLQTMMMFADGKKISTDIAQQSLAAIDENKYFELVDNVLKPDAGEAMRIIDHLLGDGRDVGEVLNGLVGHIRTLLVIKTAKDTAKLLFLTEEEKKKFSHQSQSITIGLLLQMIDLLAEVNKGISLNLNAQTMLEKFIVCSIIFSRTENKAAG